MNGLRTPYARDVELPARAARRDEALCPPSPERLLELVREHLVLPEAEAPAAGALEFARWKPGRSITAVYALRYTDGEERLVTYKRYAGEKARFVAESYKPGRRVLEQVDRLRPSATVPEDGICLWSFPADRVLRGLARLLDPRRTARRLASAYAPRTIRRRRTVTTLLRFKPERRAVLALDLKLRDAAGDPSEMRIAARVLPAEHATTSLRRRLLCFQGDRAALAPRVVARELDAGVLFEEWIAGHVPEPGDFSQAEQAGRAVAALHRGPSPEGPTRRSPSLELAALRPLLATDPLLLELADALPLPRLEGPSVWIHGDLHPDNVAYDEAMGVHRLLDLDALAPGTPAADLATWIAEALDRDERGDLRTASEALLAGYESGGGTPPGVDELAGHVAFELVRRAAAGLRRLEQNAVPKAARLLRVARAYLPHYGPQRPRSRVEDAS